MNICIGTGLYITYIHIYEDNLFQWASSFWIQGYFSFFHRVKKILIILIFFHILTSNERINCLTWKISTCNIFVLKKQSCLYSPQKREGKKKYNKEKHCKHQTMNYLLFAHFNSNIWTWTLYSTVQTLFNKIKKTACKHYFDVSNLWLGLWTSLFRCSMLT